MKIGIVHSNLTTGKNLQRMLNADPNYQVCWVTAGKDEMLRNCKIEMPDLFLLDIKIPQSELITRTLVKEMSRTVIVLTDDIDTNASKVFDLMGSGAIDVVRTPYMRKDKEWTGIEQFLKKISLFSVLLGKPSTTKVSGNKECQSTIPRPQLPPLIVIGASTGGPSAIAKILKNIPPKFCAAFIIIQHVDEMYIEGFSRWLQEFSKLPVRLAQEGSRPQMGEVLIAATNQHMVMTKEFTLTYVHEPTVNPYKPSIDVLFGSIADHWPEFESSIAVLLTGMGSDGAKGLKLLHQKGWHTIAEEKSSCIVYGMPKAAVELKAAKVVLQLDMIAPELIQFINSRQSK